MLTCRIITQVHVYMCIDFNFQGICFVVNRCYSLLTAWMNTTCMYVIQQSYLILSLVFFVQLVYSQFALYIDNMPMPKIIVKLSCILVEMNIMVVFLFCNEKFVILLSVQMSECLIYTLLLVLQVQVHAHTCRVDDIVLSIYVCLNQCMTFFLFEIIYVCILLLGRIILQIFHKPCVQP